MAELALTAAIILFVIGLTVSGNALSNRLLGLEQAQQTVQASTSQAYTSFNNMVSTQGLKVTELAEQIEKIEETQIRLRPEATVKTPRATVPAGPVTALTRMEPVPELMREFERRKVANTTVFQPTTEEEVVQRFRLERTLRQLALLGRPGSNCSVSETLELHCFISTPEGDQDFLHVRSDGSTIAATKVSFFAGDITD